MNKFSNISNVLPKRLTNESEKAEGRECRRHRKITLFGSTKHVLQTEK